MPKKLTDKFEAPNGKYMNVSSTGVEIRFVINSGTAVVRMQSTADKSMNSCFHVYRGGIQGGYPDHENNTYVPNVPTDFVFEKQENIDTLREMAKAAGDSFDPDVVRIIFDRGAYKILDISGDMAPPAKEPDTWRRIIKETVNRLAFENVTFINGLELLGDITLLSADEIHPSIYGVQQIADRLTDILKRDTE